MHIKFAPRKADLEAADRDTLISLLDEISRSALRGYHRFTIGRAVGNWCIENMEGNATTKRRIVQLSEGFAKEKENYDRSSAKLDIKLGDAPPTKSAIGEWEIGHQNVALGNYLEPVNIVVEDATADGNFIRFLAIAEAKRLKLGPVIMTPVNGGGSGTYKEFKRHLEDARITICVVDHDRLNPHGPRSQTNLRCQAIERKHSDSYIGAFMELPGREIENFLPMDVIGLLPNRGLKREHGILRSQISAQRECGAGDCLWLFFDVKEGLQIDKFKNACKSDNAKNWAFSKFGVSRIDDLDRLSIPGFGEDIPSLFLDNHEAQKEFINFTRSSYWKLHFSDWVRKLIDFAASAEKLRA